VSSAPDLHLSAAQQELYETTRGLAAGRLTELARQGTPGTVNRALIRGLAEHGLLARLFTAGRLQAMDLCLVREALARDCTEAETAFALQGLGAHPVLLAGSSDVAALTLTAQPDRQTRGHRLTGSKLWISNAPDADIYTVFARAPEGITAFAVPGDSPGLTGERKSMLAPHAIGSLEFDGVAVPPENRLGAPGEGFKVAMRTLDLFRPSVGAFAIGMARAALEMAVEHARTRQAFGRPLSANQAVSHRLAELAARTQAARLLVHQAAAAHDAGRPDRALAAMAKLLATETAQAAVDAAVQVHGARGLEQGHPLEHLYRDVRAPRIYEGASEIQREIIARSLFGR